MKTEIVNAIIMKENKSNTEKKDKKTKEELENPKLKKELLTLEHSYVDF